jgi:hypothetical protein
MTKEEAIQAMQEGKAVAHRNFTDDEHIIMQKGEIYDEAGYCLKGFWECRQGESFQDGWRIVEV